MSEVSDSSYPESTAGPTSPIFGTASFSTFTTTALTSLWPPSSNHDSRSGSSCGSENDGSEVMTYQDNQSIGETEGEAIAVMVDEISNIDDDDSSELSVQRSPRSRSSTTLSSSYGIHTTSGEYTRTPTRSSQSRSYSDADAPIYLDSYLTSSSEQLGGTLSRSTLTPTYTENTPLSYSRSYTPSSSGDRSGHAPGFPQATVSRTRRTAGELIAFYEEQAHSRVASAPADMAYSRPGSPTKPLSHSNSAPIGMPGALPAGRSDGASWRSSSQKTLSSWSFGSERSRSPAKSASESGSAVSGSVVSRSTGYTRSGSTRNGYADALFGAIGGLVGFSGTSASSRISTMSSRSPSRRRRSPSTPRMKERTASSPRSAFSQPRRSPKAKGKERERQSLRNSPSPAGSELDLQHSDDESVEEVPSLPIMAVPPLDVQEYGGSGEPLNMAPVWYYNVHRLPPYTWSYAQGYLFPHMMLLSWVGPSGGRVVVKLDLLSCVEIRTSRAQGASDVRVERDGESHRLQTFELGYGDSSIERLGCETRVEMLDWFNSIQTVFNGIISMTPSERVNERPASPAVTTSSWAFTESVISSQLQSAPASISQSLSDRRSRDQRPTTPTVPLTEGVLRSATPPIDATVNSWRARALERSTVTSTVSSIAIDTEESATKEVSPPSRTHSQLPPSRLSRSYGPSPGSHTTSSAGTLSASARTILEIGSSTGTDIVASTLSFRGTASASLLGDSCVTTTASDTLSTDSRDRLYHRHTGAIATHSQPAAEPRVEEAQLFTERSVSDPSPQGQTNETKDVHQGRASFAPRDELLDSPATQASDSDYVTASSPSASFVSLSGISAFPEDDDDEENLDRSLILERNLEDAPGLVKLPMTSTMSELEAETVQAEDDAVTIAPLNQGTLNGEESKDSEISTPVLATLDVLNSQAEPDERVQAGNPPEDEVTAKAQVVLRVDAATQADIEEPEIDGSLPVEQIPLPPPAETVYSPVTKSVGVSPLPTFEPLEAERALGIPDSPLSEVLSTLSAAVPALAQLPRVTEQEVKQQHVDSSPTPMESHTPVPSLTSGSLSDATPDLVRSPSLVESMWPTETDKSYDSSVLNASPSLRSESRAFTTYADLQQSPSLSELKPEASALGVTTNSLLSRPAEDVMISTSSDADSADDALTPTASSWLSSLPPSVPSNTLNESESIVHDPSEVGMARPVDTQSLIFHQSVINDAIAPTKVFMDQACQAENISLSPHMIPLPMSPPPTRHSVSVSVGNSDSAMEDQEDSLGRLADLKDKLSYAYSQESERILEHLDGMGVVINNDHLELRNMLAELLETVRPQDKLLGPNSLEQEAIAAKAISTMPTINHKVDFATSPIMVAMVDCSTSPPPVLFKDQAVSPVMASAYRDMDTGMTDRSRQIVNTILLTPPPRQAASPDTLMETMSYLSSHHSDDLSELDAELNHDTLHLERVISSWGSDSSGLSTRLSTAALSEEDEMCSVRSASAPPVQESAVADIVDNAIASDKPSAKAAHSSLSPDDNEMSSLAGGPLLQLPNDQADFCAEAPQSTLNTDAIAIQMPVPLRAGLPFVGQLAKLISPIREQTDRSVSANLSEVLPDYIHQATSPVPQVDNVASSPLSRISLVDKAVDSTVPELPAPPRSEKSVDASDPALVAEQIYDHPALAERFEASSPHTSLQPLLGEPLQSIVKEAEIQVVDTEHVEQNRVMKDQEVQESIIPRIMALPTFMQDQPTFSAHVKNLVTSGLSPALENVALLVQENRMAHDELRKVHEGYRYAHEETVMRVQEMYRFAQDEIMNSIAQLKAMLSHVAVTHTAVPGSSPSAHPQLYSTPPGFVAHPGHMNAPQPTFFPTPAMAQSAFPQPALFPSLPPYPFAHTTMPQPVFMSSPAVVPSLDPMFTELSVVPPAMMSPTLSASDSSITPTLRDAPLRSMYDASVLPTVFQETMIPLPPSPMYLSPQPLNLPVFADTPALSAMPALPVVPAMPSQPSSPVIPTYIDEAQDAVNMRNLGHEVSETQAVSSSPSCTVRSVQLDTTALPAHAVHTSPRMEGAVSDILPHPTSPTVLDPDPSPRSVSLSPQPVQHMHDIGQSDTTAEDEIAPISAAPVTTLSLSPHPFERPNEVEEAGPEMEPKKLEAEFVHPGHVYLTMQQAHTSGDSDGASDSDMSGLTTPLRSNTPAHDAVQRGVSSPLMTLDDSGVDSEAELNPTLHHAPVEDLHDSKPRDLVVQADEMKHDVSEPTHVLGASIYSAATDLKQVVEEVRHATQGALAASKEAQAMLESVRMQREDITRQLDECTREREAAKVDREEAQALRERALTEAASERERDVTARDARIHELECELEQIRAKESELSASQTEAISERDTRIRALEDELQAIRSELAQEKEARDAEQAERRARDEAQDLAHVQEKADQDSRIATMEEELTALRAEKEEEQKSRALQGENYEKTLADLASQTENRDERIRQLEQELADIRREQEGARKQRELEDLDRNHIMAAREKAFSDSTNDNEARIQSLERDLVALREESERQLEEHRATISQLEVAQEESVKAQTETALQQQQTMAERDARIASLEEEISQMRTEHDAELERQVGEERERTAALAERENALAAISAEREGRIKALEEQLAQVLADRDANDERRTAEEADRQAAWDERERALQDAAADRDARIGALEEELSVLRSEREQEKAQREVDDAERVRREREQAEAALARELLNAEQHDARIKELTVELATLRVEREQDRQLRATEEAERREADRAEVRQLADAQQQQLTGIHEKLEKWNGDVTERFSAVDTKLGELAEVSTERFGAVDAKLEATAASLEKMATDAAERYAGVETRFADVEGRTDEQFAGLEGRLEKMAEASGEKFGAVEAQLGKLDEDAIRDREQHALELAEAAAKPTVESLFEQHMAVLKAQVQEQIDALEQDLKTEGARQHEEIVANVRGTIEEQATVLVTTCLDELGKLLESIGAQQQAELLSAMRVSIQEQVTFNISFYLDELTKMLDSQGVRQLAETIEAVRATAQEQVPYNTENHLTDFCKNLAPEMLQLFQEIKEKAEEKSRLDRQIDILRRHKHDYEAGDLRGDEFADAPPPPPIHVSRSDADLHKAWRGRRKNDGAGGFMYPDPEWTHDTFDNAPPDVGAGGGLIAPPLDAASFYRQ